MTSLVVTRPRRVQVKTWAGADPLLTIAAMVCALMVLLAVIGPWIAPFPPEQTDILAAGQGPSGQHLLGTDALGRDILSRLLTGARLSLLGPGIIVSAALLSGTAFGIAAAWFGGWIDSALAKICNVMFAVPGVLAAVVASAVLGGGFWAPVISLSIVYTPYIARVVRTAAMAERQSAYVEACELAGMSALRICGRHILRNVSPVIFAQATISFGSALMDFGAASFLGLGVQSPTAEWGIMISDGRAELLDGNFQQSMSAGLMIVIAVVAFNVLGERITSKGSRR